jgi:uncharacterized protein YidB (DUF937 family)
MSLLNDLLGGGQGNEAAGGSLVSMAGELINKAGGLQGLIGMLQQHGLGDAVQSWVGTGSNQQVSGAELGQALNNGGLGATVEGMAAKLGVDPGQLLGQLSQVLPHAVDHLTPEGQVPQGQPAGGGFDLGALAGLAGKLMGSRA